MTNLFDILIIGKVPPPTGGVAIHVDRLLKSLNNSDLKYLFFNLKCFRLRVLIRYMYNARFIHLHTSNVVFRFIFLLVAKILNKRCIVTFHGNLGRNSSLYNLLDVLSLKISYLPIVLNHHSFEIAAKHNFRAVIISSFIPPLDKIPLSNDLLKKIQNIKLKYKYIFSTNAYGLTYDKFGNEIYQISNLINIFANFENYALIVSDPSSENYLNSLKNQKSIPNNVYFINENHDFTEVIKISHCMVRYTSTDGDSISVKESLYYNVPVIASNVVSRPNGCIIVDFNLASLEKTLKTFVPVKPFQLPENGFVKLYNIYRS